VPADRQARGSLPAALAHWHDLDHEFVREYRATAQVLGHYLAEQSVRKLLLTPCQAGLEKSVAQIAMGLTLETGRRLLLVDVDLGDPGLAAAFELATAPGWAEVALGLPLEQALQDTGWIRLHLLAQGNRLANRLANRVDATLAKRLTDGYDLTIVHLSMARLLYLAHLGLPLDAYCMVTRGSAATEPLVAMGGLPFLGTLLVCEERPPQAA
jgi:hypothetical protein